MMLSRVLALVFMSLMSSSSALSTQISFSNYQEQLKKGPKRYIQTDLEQRSWMSEYEVNELIRKSHEVGRCGGFFDITENPDVAQAVVESLIPFQLKQPDRQEEVMTLIDGIDSENLWDFIKKLSSFRTRYYKSKEGVEAAKWIASEMAVTAESREDAKVSLFEHKNFPQPSVIAEIEGEGPLKDELVVLGAHLDSIGFFGGFGSAPGEDDDASGVATLMETYRNLIQSGFKPKRTIQFIGYAGEERGLLGSQEIANQYKEDGRKVAAVIQFDMTMFPGSGDQIALVTDFVDSGLTEFLAMLIDEYVKVPWKRDRCGYACSDHASWHRAGFPVSHPFESAARDRNRKIHTSGDIVEKEHLSHGMHFAKIAVAFAVELSSD